MSRRKALERANKKVVARWFEPGEWVSVKVLPKAPNIAKQWERRSGPFQVIARYKTVYSLKDKNGVPLVKNYHGDRLMPYFWDDHMDSTRLGGLPSPDQGHDEDDAVSKEQRQDSDESECPGEREDLDLESPVTPDDSDDNSSDGEVESGLAREALGVDGPNHSESDNSESEDNESFIDETDNDGPDDGESHVIEPIIRSLEHETSAASSSKEHLVERLDRGDTGSPSETGAVVLDKKHIGEALDNRETEDPSWTDPVPILGISRTGRKRKATEKWMSWRGYEPELPAGNSQATIQTLDLPGAAVSTKNNKRLLGTDSTAPTLVYVGKVGCVEHPTDKRISLCRALPRGV